MNGQHQWDSAMREAIALARKGRFRTAPNPSVGAVLVREGRVVARGWHTAAGEAHAEVEALRDAAAKGIDPASCTLVVTLEPCCHHGQTPPCTEAILQAGIRHVVVGASDPNPEACGGADKLREAGVTVETGILQRECEDIIADFVTWQTTDLPYTILKLASTLDGRIATRTGHSQWISCEKSRQFVHEMRRFAGAVLVGGKTFSQDNPSLTCRPAAGMPAPERQPLAVVVTSRLPADSQSRLIAERPHETIFWTTVAAAASPRAEALRALGVRVVGLDARQAESGSGIRAELDLAEGLKYLRNELDCRYVLCEGGGKLGLSLLRRGLVGEMHMHVAPRILADNEATPLFDGMSPQEVSEGLSLRVTRTVMCSNDIIVMLRPDNAPDIASVAAPSAPQGSCPTA